MNRREKYALIVTSLMALVTLIFLEVVQSASRNLAAAAGSSVHRSYSAGYQILPTATPQFAISEEVLTTNPVLLQIIIILSIVAVLVIFWGVWSNRRKLDLR